MQSAPGFPVPLLPSLSQERVRFCAPFADPRAARPGAAAGHGGGRLGWEIAVCRVESMPFPSEREEVVLNVLLTAC